MAQIKKTKPEDLDGFGRRLLILCRENDVFEPAAVALALYEKYYDIVQPGTRNNKHGISVKSPENDVKALTRAIQKHFNVVDAYKVQSHFMYAYSLLFNCSLDYLYGRTAVKSCDLEVRSICDKLHIDERAVNNLIAGYDEDPDKFSATRCWSDVLSDELFEKIPYEWLRYSMEVLEFEDLAKKIEAIRKAEQSAEDLTYRTMMEERRVALEKMQPGKSSDCEGAFRILSQTLSKYIDSRTEIWVDSRHTELADNYYDNEIKKMKTLQAALKEGANPVKRSDAPVKTMESHT